MSRPALQKKPKVDEQSSRCSAASRTSTQMLLFSYAELGEQTLPLDYPSEMPKTYGGCLRLRLGIDMPCTFARCRHNLLADVDFGATEAIDLDAENIWDHETCSLHVAGRGAHSPNDVASLASTSLGTVEEYQRRSVSKVKAGLGLESRPVWRGHKENLRYLDGFAEAVRNAPEVRPKAPPVRMLTREEIEREYAGRSVRQIKAKRTKT